MVLLATIPNAHTNSKPYEDFVVLLIVFLPRHANGIQKKEERYGGDRVLGT